MLISKGFSNGDVVVIKLINGDEIMARFESDDSTSVKISRPLAITIGPQGLGMMPWIFLAKDEEFSLSKDQFFVMCRAKDDAAKQYMQGTTGIALR